MGEGGRRGDSLCSSFREKHGAFFYFKKMGIEGSYGLLRDDES